MKKLKISHSNPLNGTVNVPGSKNSALGLVLAATMSSEPVVLKNVPDILDLDFIIQIARGINLNIEKKDDEFLIDSSKTSHALLDINASSSYRASYYFIGALLSKHKIVRVGYPGGDNFGSRPIDQHVKGFEALGASVNYYENYYEVSCEQGLVGAEINFDVVSAGATINILLASTLAKGITVLNNSAIDPEISDIALFLNQAGAKISGIGTSTLLIEGVTSLKGITYEVCPDRHMAGFYMIAAAVTKGNLYIKNIRVSELTRLIENLRHIGIQINILSETSIHVLYNSSIKLQPIDVTTGMFPQFSSDLQQPLTSLLLQVNGKSTVTDIVFTKRFSHVPELKKMGANIKVKNNKAIIEGGYELFGAQVTATDVRSGLSLILCALVAKGDTFISNTYHIERFCKKLPLILKKLGAQIEFI